MFKDVLFPIDLGSADDSRKALEVALKFCADGAARLHVMTVVPGFGMSIVSQYFPKDFETKALEETSHRLQEYVSANVPDEVRSQTIVANGTVYEEILTTAAELGCDLIVMAAHRPDLKDYLLGPNTSRVVRHANCSVVTVRD